MEETDPVDTSLNTMDGARHRHMRRLAEDSIAAALHDYVTTAKQRADDLLSRILSMGAFDMVEVARDFGSHILFDLLEVPDADRAQLIAWTYGSPRERSDEARKQYYRDLIAGGASSRGATSRVRCYALPLNRRCLPLSISSTRQVPAQAPVRLQAQSRRSVICQINLAS